MAGRTITVDFIGNDKSLSSTAQKASGSTSKLGATLGKVAKVGAIGLAAGAVVAGKALFDMTKGAIEDEAAQKRLATALKNNAGATKGQVASVEDWITAQGKAFGVADDDLRPALEKLVSATHDVGKAQKLTSLAMDVSAGSGKSLEAVSTALMKAQNGQVGALSRLGINTKDATGHTISFEQATKRMADTFGGQAQTQANTLDGKMRRLKLILSETGETIGAKLIPVVTKMADWFLNVGLPAISRFGTWLQKNLGPIFEQIGAVIRRVTAGMNGDVGKNLAAVKDTFRSIVSIIQSLWQRFGKTLVQYAVSTFKNVRQIIGGALKVIQGIFKVFSSLLKGDWRGVWTGIKQILSGSMAVIKGIVKQGLNVLRLMFKVAWIAIKGIVGGVWDGIKTLVRNGASSIVSGIKALPGRLRALAGSFGSAGHALISAFVNGLKNAAGIVSGIAGNVWSAVRSMLNGAIDRINSALSFTIHLPGPDISVNAGHIPHLAKGGLVSKPTLALIGEDGPEAVVPLGRKNAPKGGISLGGGTSLHIHFHQPVAGDPRAFAKAVRTELLKEKRLLGTPLGLA